MTIIDINNKDEQGSYTNDSAKYSKDCADFQCLDDGTIVGECRYCNLSLICRQIGVLPNGEVVGMESHYLPVLNENGELVAHDLFCTGMYDLRPYKERIEDDKVS